MPKVIGIIGGNGKMGRCFASIFREHGLKVLVSDKGTKLTNKKLVQKSDMVFVSVPITSTKKVLEEILPMMKKNQALLEITSIKDPLIPIFKSAKCEILSLHPMCNETQLASGARMLFMPVRGKKTENFFKKLFLSANFQLVPLKIEKHDKLMAMIQGLPHFAEIAFAHTMKDLGFKTNELMRFASPATDLKLKMVGRILAQDAELYGAMQIYNPRNKTIIGEHIKSVNELYKILEEGDLPAFEKYFKASAKFLGKYKDDALSETDHVISTLRCEDLIGDKLSDNSNTNSKRQNLQKKKSSPLKTLSLLGPAMTYTDAATTRFSALLKKYIKTKLFKSTIEDVFVSVANGETAFGIVPIENRLYGTVRETLDGLFTHDVKIIELVSMPINHCIAVLPGVIAKDIKIVMSHGQALSQCKKYLQSKFKTADLVSVSSSAKAFENVKMKNFRHIAVIGNVLSAKHYGFKILKEKIADREDNITKFVVISKNSKYAERDPKNTAIAFYFSKDKAGSLFTVFQAFAENKVNMTRVESRPYKKDFGDYIFFIDFEGDPSDTRVQNTLKSVGGLTAGMKLLGTY